MTIKKDAWHYQMSERGGARWDVEVREVNGVEKRVIDICSYRRSVMLGLFLTLAVYSLGGAILWTFIDLAMAVWFWTEPVKGGVLGLLLLGGMGLYFSFVWVSNLCFQPREHREPGVLKQMYSSWKEKYCTYVEIE